MGDKIDGSRYILEREDIHGVCMMVANQLSIDMQLLHQIITRILVSKTGQFDFIMEREVILMTILLRGIVVYLHGIMAKQMQEAAANRRLCLPYRMDLTCIFRDLGVPLEGEAFKEIYIDMYAEKSLHRIGYRKIDG